MVADRETDPDKRSSICIITSTKNCAQALEATARSIRAQSVRPLQWIVADGASTDGTLDVIRANLDLITDWHSERDTGIYDAWNKACRHVRADWMLFLGAGDALASADVVERAGRSLADLPSEVVLGYGDVVADHRQARWIRRGEVDLNGWELYKPALPDHQGVFQRSSLLQALRFDESYRVAADSKFLIESLRQGSARYLDLVVSVMLPGGISQDPRHCMLVMREVLRLETELGYRIPFARKLVFVAITLIKAASYKLGGPRLVELIARPKRALVRGLRS
jgi:glycosyltransferase involved in cell wall biosynthesis